MVASRLRLVSLFGHCRYRSVGRPPLCRLSLYYLWCSPPPRLWFRVASRGQMCAHTPKVSIVVPASAANCSLLLRPDSAPTHIKLHHYYMHPPPSSQNPPMIHKPRPPSRHHPKSRYTPPPRPTTTTTCAGPRQPHHHPSPPPPHLPHSSHRPHHPPPPPAHPRPSSSHT